MFKILYVVEESVLRGIGRKANGIKTVKNT